MAIELNMGPGGDVADLRGAWDTLRSASPLANDYTFNQSGTFTNSASITQSIPVNLNGHTVRFVCPDENRHNGTAESGYIINLPGGQDLRFTHQDSATYIGGTLSFEGLCIKVSSLIPSMQTTEILAPWVQHGGKPASPFNILIDKCLLIGRQDWPVGGWSEGIRIPLLSTPYNYCRYVVKSSKIYNCTYGMYQVSGAETPYQGLTNADRVTENLTIYGCAYGLSVAGSDGIESLGSQFRNIVSCGSSLADYQWLWPDETYDVIENCRDSDGSLIYGSGGGTIVPADEFQSLVSTSLSFLFLKPVTFSMSATATPSSGKAPLPVAFSATPSYTQGSPNLADGGIAPTYVVTDIAGNTIPGFGDAYPIGCHVATL